uniref:NADH-ubiquinone oxidoreductase chain 3 n=1 Tax=Bothridium pithonis TaxID=1648426 RepID=A0A8F7CDE9_9CEST|nr:NADH dehydrogenase subunit 3 [Bothridium pithonis]
MLTIFYGVLIIFVVGFVVCFFTLGLFNKYTHVGVCWSSPYECGFCSSALSLNCFSFTYFSLLVFFVVFDLEISLLLNMPEQGVLYTNFMYYFVFLVILAVGFISEVFMGYVRWGV